MAKEKLSSLHLILKGGEERLNHTALLYDRVMGIITSDGFLGAKNYNIGDKYHLQKYALPQQTVERLSAFFARCYTDAPGASVIPSRSLFVRMLHEGKDADPTVADFEDYALAPHNSTVFEAGGIYALGSPEYPRHQGVLGLDRPNQNLAVLGNEAVLAVTNNTALCEAMGVTAIHEVLPPDAVSENA